MLVTEALFQAQDLLADDGEAEMSWLDRTGVHGTDRNFVHAFARDRDEGVPVRLLREALAGIEGGGTSPNAVANKLKGFEGQIIDGVFLERRAGTHNKPTAWRLVPTDPAR